VDFEELIDLAQFVLNNNDTQTDQDFTKTRIKQFLNLGYKRAILQGKQNGSKNYFKKNAAIEWPVDQLTLKLPQNFQKIDLIRIEDVTTNDPGPKLSITDTSSGGGAFWLDNNTIQWGSAGPSEAKTLRFFYKAGAEKLMRDDDIPRLINSENAPIIVWEGMTLLLEVADGKAPDTFYKNLKESRFSFWKELAQGRPEDTEPWISPRDSDYDSEPVP